MAENKQYIMQCQDKGRVLISGDVIATIAAQALTDIEGFVTLSNKSNSEYADIIGKKNWGKGIKVTVAENNEISIDCNVVVLYGTSVVTVSKAIQDAVVTALGSVTGISAISVNVNVCGIVRK